MQKFIWMEYMCIMVGFIYILVHSHFELNLFPALYTFWFLKRTAVTQKFCYWDCTNDSTNAKFPHLRICRG